VRLQVRLLTSLLAVLLGAALLVGCGGGGGGGGESATQVLDQTFGSGGAVKCGRLTLTLDADLNGVQGVNGQVQIRLDGPFQSEGPNLLPKFDFTLTLRSGGQSFSAGAVSTSDAGYLRFMDQAYAVPAKLFSQFQQGYVQAQKQSKSQKDAGSLQALGIDPRDWLRNPKKVGEEDVGGVKTIHVTSGVDVPKLVSDLRSALQRTGQGSRITPSQQRQLERAVKSAKLDVWSGADDHRLRKLAVDVGLTSGHLAFTMQLDDLGQAQTITAPANPKPLDDLLSQLQGAGLPVPSGGSSPGSGSSGGAAPSGGSKQERYLQCVQAAGQDVSKLQACAKLL
jgi:hypothetical protein